MQEPFSLFMFWCDGIILTAVFFHKRVEKRVILSCYTKFVCINIFGSKSNKMLAHNALVVLKSYVLYTAFVTPVSSCRNRTAFRKKNKIMESMEQWEKICKARRGLKSLFKL